MLLYLYVTADLVSRCILSKIILLSRFEIIMELNIKLLSSNTQGTENW
jgi:hypothetical protein